MELQKIKNQNKKKTIVKAILSKKNRARSLIQLVFKIYYKGIIMKTGGVSIKTDM
jgi:hypothetical protein